MRSTSLPEELRELRDLGVLSDLDLELAAFVAELHDARGGQEADAPERPGAAERPGAPAGLDAPAGLGAPAGLVLGAALVSRAVREGHICLDLQHFAGTDLMCERAAEEEGAEGSGRGRVLECPPLGEWEEQLRSSRLVGAPGRSTPFVLDAGHRLYLHRYWSHERNLAARVAELAAAPNAASPNAAPPTGLIRRWVQEIFGGEQAGGPAADELQMLAALTPILRRFTVVSGGPGTGKTWVVSRIILLIRAMERWAGGFGDGRAGASAAEAAGDRSAADAHQPTRPIALAAPTGKAAARLREAVSRALSDVRTRGAGDEEWESGTVHRLIGRLEREPTYRPSLVVVDEASMADLGLMTRLMTGLPEETRVVWLGDKDQLSSVEAGAVLGDVCGPSEEIGQSAGFRSQVREILGGAAADARETGAASPASTPALRDCIVLLQRSFRFAWDSGIAAVSRSVRRGDADEVLLRLSSARGEDAVWVDRGAGPDWAEALRRRVVRGFSEYCAAENPREALHRFSSFRPLCALRRGPFGVEGLNRLIERWLERAGLLAPYGRWYRSRPILVTRNDYTLRLFNGDVGVIMPDPEEDGVLRAFFPDDEGSLRSIAPARLPQHETVFAMTVHKSQGSEFDEVLLVLPDRPVPVLTRELIYTGLTRAVRRIEIWGAEEVLRHAVSRRIRRRSGLREALWGER